MDVRSRFFRTSNTLRLYFPLSLLADDGIFNYSLIGNFPFVFAPDERAPASGQFTSAIEALQPFAGAIWCPPGDSDFDGVPDEVDACPNSMGDATVLIGSCDSGVPNFVLPNGCNVLEVISSCGAPTAHGRFVSCVTQKTAELVAAGVLTREQKRAIDLCTASSRVLHER